MALRSNGRDVLSGGEIMVEDGCGAGHIHTLFENLARMEISMEADDFSPAIQAAAQDTDPDSMYILISPFFGERCVEAFRQLQAVRPTAMWILPVVATDLVNEEFKGTQLAQTTPNVYLWKVE